MDWNSLADRVLAGATPSRAEAIAVLGSFENDLLPLLHASFRVRERHFGRAVNVHLLQNAKSGLCPEDCAFCSQSAHFQAEIPTYKLQDVDELVAGAQRAVDAGAMTYCMVTATRGPSEHQLEVICEATRRIKDKFPLRICASLGMLSPDDAKMLAEAGVDRFNHNLETAKRYFPEICSTHTWDDRVKTVEAAKAAGMEACCGGIIGMGETVADRADLAFELRALEVESIPVNFLDPRPGTPLGDRERLSPGDCLRTLAMFRFVNPTTDIRVAGGREVNLRGMQVLALYPANSLFTSGYLTTDGQAPNEDIRMIQDAGFDVVAMPG
jgi:biotin synthase